MLGEGSRERRLPEHEAGISARPVQPVRRRAMPEHLPDEGALPAQGRHRGPGPGLVHRVQVLHRGVSLRPVVHRSQHDDGGEMQLLRKPPRSEPRARLRGGLPHAVPRVRRHGGRGFENIETHHAAPLPREKARVQHGAPTSFISKAAASFSTPPRRASPASTSRARWTWSGKTSCPSGRTSPARAAPSTTPSTRFPGRRRSSLIF